MIAPLKLRSTELEPSPAVKAKLAVGHNAALQPAQSWTTMPLYAAMSPTGGLVSTTSDLLQFLSAALGYERSRLSTAMNAMLTTRRPAPPNQQALGWLASRSNNEQLIFHDGGTLGYASAVAWDPKQRVGVVVLSNQVEGVGDIARHLLRPELPLRKPTATKQTEIQAQLRGAGQLRRAAPAPRHGARLLRRRAPAGFDSNERTDLHTC